MQVPMDQAKNSLDMITNFVDDKPFKTGDVAIGPGQAVHPHSQALASVARPLRLVNS